MKIVSPEAAIAAIPDGARVILPHGAVEPTQLYGALRAQRQRFSRLRLYSGLQFGQYAYLREGLGENFAYATWQASPRLRDLFRRRCIDFLPLRFRDITRVVSRQGPLPPDVVIVQVSPPRGGAVSLGISVSVYRDLVAAARLVIAEIHPHLPWTSGPSTLPADAIHVAVDSGEPLGVYRGARRNPRDEQVVENVLGCIPPGAWVQVGIGAIPEALLYRLHEREGVNIHSGMVGDGVVDFLRRSRHRARVVTGEVAGSPVLYEFVDRNAQVELHPSSVTHDVVALSRLPRFYSVNSAVEVDLQGQVNGETVDGVQISGVGGALDFAEGAAYSEGGCSIVALASTTADGSRSKIVPSLSAGAPVTIPRYCADVVVTEYGVAELRGRTLRERAAALLQVAHPDFRPRLEEQYRKALERPGWAD